MAPGIVLSLLGSRDVALGDLVPLGGGAEAMVPGPHLPVLHQGFYYEDLQGGSRAASVLGRWQAHDPSPHRPRQPRADPSSNPSFSSQRPICSWKP